MIYCPLTRTLLTSNGKRPVYRFRMMIRHFGFVGTVRRKEYVERLDVGAPSANIEIGLGASRNPSWRYRWVFGWDWPFKFWRAPKGHHLLSPLR